MSIDAPTIISRAVGRALADRGVDVPTFEQLEPRRLMAGVSFADGTLHVLGGGRSDDVRISMSRDGSTITAKLNDRRGVSFEAARVWSIHVDAQDGNNRVTLDRRITSTTTVITGTGHDTIVTGAGHDSVRSNYGADVIDTGTGNDMIDSGASNDRVDAGAGNDFVVGGSGNDVVDAGGGVDVLLGRSGNDRLYGDADDTIDPGAGRDVVTRTSGPAAPVVPPPAVPAPVAPRVTRLRLVDADTGATVAGHEGLWDDATLDLTSLPGRITVVAETDRRAESARFTLSDGSLDRVENGDTLSLTPAASTGGFVGWARGAGTVTVSVTPYAADGASGAAGGTYSVRLRFVQTTPAPVPPPTPDPNPTVDPLAPTIRLNALDGANAIAGQGYHVQATRTTVPGYDVEDARFEWDFGDAGGRHNVLRGFNAAHVYDRPGTYTVRLTVTAPGGRTSTATTTVNVAASNYRNVYVAANGNDANDGADTGRPVKTIARAVELAGDDTQVLLRRSDTFTMTGAVRLTKHNLVIATYGMGTSPTLLYTGTRNVEAGMFFIPNQTRNVAIRGLTFNSIYGSDTEQDGLPNAIANGGRNVTVQGNTFLNVKYAINNNGLPTGLYALDNKAPLETGIRGYFSWTQGTDIVIVGNEVANSTREHIVRVFGAERVNVSNNTFDNLDRRAQGDPRDTAKGTVVIQKGAYAYVAGNELRGPWGVGPLGNADGLNEKGARFRHAAFEENVAYGGTFFFQHGAEHATLRDSTFYVDDGLAVVVTAYNHEYQRGVVDAVIDHNVGINNGTQGSFLKTDGRADGITLTSNVYVAPNLRPGSYGTAAVYVSEDDLSSFRRIDGNVWPSPARGNSYARGGMAFLGRSYTSEGHRRPAEWNDYWQVGEDRFEDVRPDDASRRTGSMLRLAA